MSPLQCNDLDNDDDVILPLPSHRRAILLLLSPFLPLTLSPLSPFLPSHLLSPLISPPIGGRFPRESAFKDTDRYTRKLKQLKTKKAKKALKGE